MTFFANLQAQGLLSILKGTPIMDLWALSLCGAGIVATSSTLSWWSAYLRADPCTPALIPWTARESGPLIKGIGRDSPADFIMLTHEGHILRNRTVSSSCASRGFV